MTLRHSVTWPFLCQPDKNNVLFTYLFGGAISGSPASYLKILLPGTLSMSIALVTMPGWLQAFVKVTPSAISPTRPGT